MKLSHGAGRRATTRRRRLVARSLVGGLALAVLFATPAHADPAGPTDYRSEVVAIEPPTEEVTVEIIGGDSFVELTAAPGTEVLVVGYAGEPYLLFGADGAVSENRNAPTTYQNASRYGADAPTDLDSAAVPDWREVAADHRWAWHDHRAHWMQTTRPLGASPGDQILEAVIPLEVDGNDVAVTVASTWQPAPSALPAWIGAASGIVLVGGAVVSRRRGARTSQWLLPPAVLATVVGVWQFTSLPSETGPRLVWWLLPAIASACAAGAVLAEWRGHRFWADAAMLAVGVELVSWGWIKRDGLSAALIPTDAPGWLDRYTVAMALAGGAGFAALALAALFVPGWLAGQRVQGGLGLAASGPPVSTS